MATYAIGDIQGCFSSLERLLDLVRFDRASDRLWCVGDVVNRGSDSLAVLRYLKGLGDAAKTVLGNHDLHAIALAKGITEARRKDTLHNLLSAPGSQELLDWLRHRPLLARENGYVILHGGLLPSWTVTQALHRAEEVEQVLRSQDHVRLLTTLYAGPVGDEQWSNSLKGMARLCLITKVLTRLRVCTTRGTMMLSYKGPPSEAPTGLLPWFEVPGRRSADTTIICGHWSALGLHIKDNVLALDSGCVWGGKLSAIRLEDRKVFQVRCADQRS